MSILRVPTFFTFFLCLNFVSHAQVLREGTKHAQLLCRDDQDYIGQPLSKVLEKISPFINAVSVKGGWFEVAPRITFFFMPFDGYLKSSAFGQSAFSVTIYLRDTFKWTMEERTREYFWKWTAEDAKRMEGNMVTYVRFSGNSDFCGSEIVLP